MSLFEYLYLFMFGVILNFEFNRIDIIIFCVKIKVKLCDKEDRFGFIFGEKYYYLK